MRKRNPLNKRVTHNEAIRYMADHILKLHDGNIREDIYNISKKKS